VEKELRYELINSISELTNSIYPTNAPEGVLKPYLVYSRINTNKIKTLDGYTNKQALSYMFSIMAQKYGDMITVRDKVEQLLLSLPQRVIGDGGSILVEDLTINNIDETWESELKVNRGIIDFTIYF
jgi:Na+/H+ antiporter NhaA